MTGPLVVVASYLLGSVPTGLWLVRWVRGLDVREHGSGNIGTTNVYRVAGLWLGAAVLAADVLKGLLPVKAAQGTGLGPSWAVAAGLASIAGHNWSAFLGFRGGKGVATSFGALVAVSPVAAAVAAGVWVLAVVLTRYASVGSVLALVSVPATIILLREPFPHVVFGLAAAAMGLVRHRENLRRLREGRELRITERFNGPSQPLGL